MRTVEAGLSKVQAIINQDRERPSIVINQDFDRFIRAEQGAVKDERKKDRRETDAHFFWTLVFAFVCVSFVAASAGFYVGAAYSASIVLGAK